jgi:serine/threonine protein kinase
MAYQEGDYIGRYRILRLFRGGGMITTYVAIDTRLGDRQVTIETFPIHSDEQLQLNIRKSTILAQLNHSNVLPTFDFGREADTFYLVNEYIPEGTLRHRHPRGTKVPLTTVMSYVKQVTAALQYMHDRGIVHRDVKPDNMFRNSDGRVVIGDFGLALILSGRTSDEQASVTGTPRYMAPEQFQGKAQRASDQYALGMVIYEWLSGEAPFSGTSWEVMQMQLHVQPPSLSTIVPGLPPEVDEVVHIALRKDPNDRFVHIKAFAYALEQASRSLSQSPALTLPQTVTTTPPYGAAVPSPNTKSPSVFRRASQSLTRLFSGKGEQKRRDTELSL